MRRRLFLVPVILACVFLSLPGAVPRAAPGAAAGRPSLVVVLVVDQMRGDYALKYGHQWKAGLRRLMDSGAWFQQAAYPYSYPVTCAGHATIATGTFPNTHGITGNSWWDRTTGTSVECADDESERTIGYGKSVPGGKSARRLMTATLTDNLRAQMPVAPRIVTFSMKERTAIMLAGQRADAVTWFEASAGSLATSSAYASAPVPFVQRFVDAHPIAAETGTAWRKRAAPAAYLYSDTAGNERPPVFWTAAFPHPLSREGMKPAQPYQAWEESPFSDAYMEKLAEAGIESLSLGKGPGTDFLGISFTALDLVGHDFGPQSHEVQDVLLRLDETIGSLMAYLDRTVGRSRYVVALTSDHGVSPIPEQMAAQGISAGRLPSAAFTAPIEKALGGAVGTGKAIARTTGGQVYLTEEGRDAVTRNRALRDRLTGDLERIPGIARVFFTTNREDWSAADPFARAARYSYYPGRAGDIIVQQLPYWLIGGAGGSAANHGTPYRYDTWVPLFFYGSGIKAGRYSQAVTPADMAPTLAWLCGVTLAHPDGRPLIEATIDSFSRATGPGSAPRRSP